MILIMKRIFIVTYFFYVTYNLELDRTEQTGSLFFLPLLAHLIANSIARSLLLNVPVFMSVMNGHKIVCIARIREIKFGATFRKRFYILSR
jgi:hypothetical protein